MWLWDYFVVMLVFHGIYTTLYDGRQQVVVFCHMRLLNTSDGWKGGLKLHTCFFCCCSKGNEFLTTMSFWHPILVQFLTERFDRNKPWVNLVFDSNVKLWLDAAWCASGYLEEMRPIPTGEFHQFCVNPMVAAFAVKQSGRSSKHWKLNGMRLHLWINLHGLLLGLQHVFNPT